MDEPMSMVKYLYAYDNPVMSIDPDGRSVWGTITAMGSKAYTTAKSWAGNAVNAVKKTAGYVKDKVAQGIENVRRAGRAMLDTAASYMQKVACMIPDGVKKVWSAATKLYDKIPIKAKFVIGAVGVVASVVTGAAPLGVAIGTLAVAMYSGAAINAGIYAAGAFFGYHDFSWKEMGKKAIDGAADGALFAGVGMIAKSVTYAVKNPEPLKAFLADETGGEINLSKFGKKKGKGVKGENYTDIGNGKQYSVMYEASPGKGKSRSAHRNAANREFHNQMASDYQFKKDMDDYFGYDVMEYMKSGKSGLKNPSPDWVWHHPADNPNAIQLIPKNQHQSSILQSILYPGENGKGGFGLLF